VNRLRILIVDDEPLARERIRTLLRNESAMEIAGECGSGPEALEAIHRDRPDIVFLDMQMPGCDGLEVAAALPLDQRPAIIFVTAHDRFAVDAFAVRAVDYLLKPFDQERLLQAIKRATDHLQTRRDSDLGTRIEGLLANAVNERTPGRLAVRTDGRVVFLKPEEIAWVEAANNYSILHLADQRRLMIRETLAALDERLGQADFARINRSTIVRIDQVKELQSTEHGDHGVVLQDGTRFSLSRNLRGRLERFIP
jgi:two-component system LytT family response regulator